MQWNEYTNKHFSYNEGMFVVVPLPPVVDENNLELAFEIVMHAEINNTNYAFR